MIYMVAGNTIRLFGTFYNYADELVDPTDAKMTIYDAHKQFYAEYEPMIKSELGIWYYDFETPILEADTLYYFEPSGVVDGKTELSRGQFTTKFFIEAS